MKSKNKSDEKQIQKINDYFQLRKKLKQALSVSSDSGMTRIYSAIKHSN